MLCVFLLAISLSFPLILALPPLSLSLSFPLYRKHLKRHLEGGSSEDQRKGSKPKRRKKAGFGGSARKGATKMGKKKTLGKKGGRHK